MSPSLILLFVNTTATPSYKVKDLLTFQKDVLHIVTHPRLLCFLPSDHKYFLQIFRYPLTLVITVRYEVPLYGPICVIKKFLKLVEWFTIVRKIDRTDERMKSRKKGIISFDIIQKPYL